MGQNVVLSKPEHMIALPPEKTGAQRFLTMPPTWKRGIMFTRNLVGWVDSRSDKAHSLLMSLGCKFHECMTAHVPTTSERRV